MPNIKSSAKRDELSKAQNLKKKFDMAVAEGDRNAAVSAYKVAVKTIDHAATKRLIHKNHAANKKSKLSVKLNNMA